MKLEGDFYKIIGISQNETGYEVIVEFNERHAIYAGHFPGHPVVPGICILTVIRECLQKILKRNVVFREIKECKFLLPLIPHKGLQLKIDIKTMMPAVNCIMYESENAVLKLKARID